MRPRIGFTAIRNFRLVTNSAEGAEMKKWLNVQNSNDNFSLALFFSFNWKVARPHFITFL